MRNRSTSTRPADASDAGPSSIPMTGYATLGLLSPNERFTAVEIQERAYNQLRHFYWTPALSHIRRELRRLEDLGYIDATVVQQGRVKRTLRYSITDLGSRALAEWTERPDADPMIIKNTVLLRLWLGRRAEDPDRVLAALERHIAHVEEELASLAAQASAEARAHKERVLAIDQLPTFDDTDMATYAGRAAWHHAVMDYCRRQYEHELASSQTLLADLRSISD
ncbi:PadR family transcriptional regulator [Gordonia sp. NPDC127522]|uniref:PadR family transcriptional regulator n=1 Tax=Gordonia sp. NPDC127522 TaxID=3345390 RepID=UPI003624C9E0